MELLEAALSFALLMIIFSTLVATITETWLRVRAQRARVLVHMMRAFLQNDPYFSKWLEQAAGELKEADGRLTAQARDELEKLVNRLTENPALGALDDGITRGWLAQGLRAVGRFLRGQGGNRVDELSTFAFLQRVAKTEAGQKIAAMTDTGQMADLLKALSASYERYVAASNEVFRKRAQAVSMVISILVAFAVNFDTGQVFRHLADNPDTRRALIAEAEAVTEENREALKDLQHLLDMTPGTRVQEIDEEDLAEEVSAIRATLDKLNDGLSLPLGYEHSPFWDDTAQEVVLRLPENAVCDKADPDARACLAAGDVALWAIQVLVAGFLIGLGGPFWYKFYTSLSSVLQVLRSFGGKVPRETIEPDDTGGQQPVAGLMAKAVREGDRDMLTESFRIAADRDAVNAALGKGA